MPFRRGLLLAAAWNGWFGSCRPLHRANRYLIRVANWPHVTYG
jgi:hypothetical protein